MNREFLVHVSQRIMKVSRSHLQSLLSTHIADIRFVRRRATNGRPGTRRMLCTNSSTLLNSVNGRTTLNYRAPKHGLDYNPVQKDLVLTWDIIMQEYRMVNMVSCELIRSWPAEDEFWSIFNEEFYHMDAGAKLLFMDT